MYLGLYANFSAPEVNRDLSAFYSMYLGGYAKDSEHWVLQTNKSMLDSCFSSESWNSLPAFAVVALFCLFLETGFLSVCLATFLWLLTSYLFTVRFSNLGEMAEMPI